MITTKLIKIQIIKEADLLNKRMTPGKNRTSSRSKRTNKIAKKKKGVLTETRVNKLSNPDSRGERDSLFVKAFFDKNTCTIRTTTKAKINPIVKIIMTLKLQLTIY